MAIVLAAETARLSIAESYAEEQPGLAERLAPGTPDALRTVAMAEIGQAAAEGTEPTAVTIRRLEVLSARAPLAPEPFLVQAALAQRQGDLGRAERLLLHARWRNPRSHAARYLLADVWLRQGRVLPALSEMALLARLVPQSSVQLVPALSDYAKAPGARDELRRVLEVNPYLRRPLLNALAADPDNAGLILALAGPSETGSKPPGWQARLLDGLVARADYGRAYALWRRFAGIPEGQAPLVFNGEFRPSSAPPPFNWRYTSSAAGVAEPSGGRLRVLYYGRNNTTLAEQLLLLGPGAYSFAAPASGDAAQRSLTWTLTCVADGRRILRLPVGNRPAAQFQVPQTGCAAQKLVLSGEAQEMPRDTDVQIGPVAIGRAGG